MKTLKPIKWTKTDKWTWQSGYANIYKYIQDPAFYPLVMGCSIAPSFGTLKAAKLWCQSQLQERYNTLIKQIEEMEIKIGVEKGKTGNRRDKEMKIYPSEIVKLKELAEWLDDQQYKEPLKDLAEWLNNDQQFKPYQPDFNEKASEWHEIIEHIIEEAGSED